ncbi:MAG: hypothetical protein RIC55_04065 [Pirellulaceae bacterium]
MRRRLYLLALATLSVLLLQAAANLHAQTEPVGDLCHPSRIVVRGAADFTEEQIRQALFDDLEVLLAAHPCAPLAEYPHVIRRRLTAGYEANGYRDATISTSFDRQQQRITVDVEEGKQHLSGEIVIEGAKQLDVEQLVQRLTQPQSAANVSANPPPAKDGGPVENLKQMAAQSQPPIWRTGKPAPFGFSEQQRLIGEVRKALADLGLPFARFELSVEAQPDSDRARLKIEITDEGRPAVVEAVDVTGAERNSRESILDLIGLEPGRRFTTIDEARAMEKLQETGRFLKVDVETEENVLGEGVRVRINLVEYPYAPRLGEPLTERQQLMVKLRQWLVEFEHSGDDLVAGAVGSSFGFDMAFSPRRGMIGSFWKNPQEKDDAASSLLRTLAVSDDRLGYYNFSAGRMLNYPSPESQIALTLSLKANPDYEDGRDFVLGFGFNVRSRSDDEPLPVNLKIQCTAAAAFALAHHFDEPGVVEDGKIVLRHDTDELTLDVETGRLISCVVFDEADKQKEVARLVSEAGALSERLRRLDQRAAGLENAYDAKRPLSSLIDYALEDGLVEFCFDLCEIEETNKQRQQWERMAPTVRRVVAAGVLEPIDRLIAEHGKKKPQTFKIPSSHWGKAPSQNPMTWIGALALSTADELFPHRSWPWTVWRETGLVVASQSRYTGQEINRLLSAPESGPLCHLVIAGLLHARGVPQARLAAERGLTRLSVFDFQNDCRALFDKEMALGAALLKLAEAARELNDEEAGAVGRELLGENARHFVECVRTLRERRDEPVETVLPEALGRLWEQELLHTVSRALEDIRQR